MKPTEFLIYLLTRVLLVTAIALSGVAVTAAQARKAKRVEPVPTELAKLRDEYIKATKDYKANLTKLLALYERNVTTAEEKLAQSQKLFSEGLISKNQVTEYETAVATARDKVTETKTQMANADAQIAGTLLEAQAEAQLARNPVPRGALVRTTSYIRYGGSGGWNLSEAWKVQRFFTDSFKKPLPVTNFGQGAIHAQWGLDHRNAMDISLHPDGAEGQALMNFLRANGIPFLAFRSAIPGTSTGPHIHVGRPSHRY